MKFAFFGGEFALKIGLFSIFNLKIYCNSTLGNHDDNF